MAEHYDVAIAGGGIAGLYCALGAPGGLDVALFEGSDRFGGKIETVEMAGFKAEYGSMRFDPERQPLMGLLIKELGLETEHFPKYSSPPVERRRGSYQLDHEQENLDALELFALGISKILNISRGDMKSISEVDLEALRSNARHRGNPIWQQGIWNMLSDVLGYEAVRYIMTEGSFFHGIHENPGGAGTLITWVKMLQMSEHLKGIKGGMDLITARMLKKVRNKAKVFAGSPLVYVKPGPSGSVIAGFETREVIADHLMLALPQCALKRIAGLPPAVVSLLDTVHPYPLLKCFFVVTQPWWEGEVPNQGVERFPARELHYYRHQGHGNIMLYADRPYANFWGRYLVSNSHDRAESNGHRQLPLVFAELMGLRPGQVIEWGIRDWRMHPYGAGVHLWRAGVEPWRISEELEAFSLDGSSRRNVHICGEAFSDYQGFMEGALRSAQSAMTRALN